MTSKLDPTASSIAFRCRICEHAGAFRVFRPREMMFGSGEVFDYVLCPACGCLQIAEVPDDLARHYGEGFYSYGGWQRRDGLAAALLRARNRYLAGDANPLGWAMARARPFTALASLRRLQLARDARIVDVGCGGGELLLALQSAGFESLLGVDPFVAEDIDLGGGLQVRRCELNAVEGDFDLVMFHHSLEHIVDSVGALHAARRLLAPGGRCIVRIPTVSSHAWRHYGTDWCALDAPRHIVLHSVDSIRGMAGRCGFVVEKIVSDANGYQFWGSEQFRRGIATMRPGSQDIAPAPGVFAPAELKAFERRAKALNAADDGDQIAVYLNRGA